MVVRSRAARAGADGAGGRDTAAVITPVGELIWEGGSVGDAAAPTGPVTTRIRQRLVDIQYGRAEDTHGWMRRLV